MKRSILIGLSFLATLSMSAKVKLPALIADNMMLQQQTEATLWGEASPNAQVRITPSWSNQSVACKADAQGRWKAKVSTPAGSYTPYEITFDDGSESVKVKNVLVGEVWLASGQSNMEMPMKGTHACPTKDNVDDVITASVQSPGVRMFNVPREQTFTPQESCGGSWLTTENFMDAMEFSAAGFYFATQLSKALHIPVGIINSSYGGTKVESWMPREVLAKYPDMALDSVSVYKEKINCLRPMLNYNAMINPIKQYTMKGIIWYQGCSNVGQEDTYPERLAAMVKDWREEMNCGELPFYYVEIAPFNYHNEKSAYLREAQSRALQLIPNSGMICTNDLVAPYEINNIHPRDKKSVGHRLCYLALAHTYGFDNLRAESPRYKSHEIKEHEIVVTLEHVEQGLTINNDIQGFEIAGDDRVFYPADKVSVDWVKGIITVSSEKVAKPASVRYCFHDFQLGNLTGANELPLIPFRTDNW